MYHNLIAEMHHPIHLLVFSLLQRISLAILALVLPLEPPLVQVQAVLTKLELLITRVELEPLLVPSRVQFNPTSGVEVAFSLEEFFDLVL